MINQSDQALPDPRLSYPADQVRRYDHDRFMTAIFAPASVREHLFALYAFNIEVAKTGEVVSESLIGQIRLQWWRDTLDRLYAGETVAHGVARPLGEAIASGRLDRIAFDRLIDAREFDLDRIPPADFAALHDYAEGTGSPLLELALRIAGGDGAVAQETARLVGVGWALTGLLRAVPFHARQRRIYLPADRLEQNGVKIARLFELKADPGLPEVICGIGEHARRHFLKARKAVRGLPRQARSPALLAELGLLHLADLERAGWNPFTLETLPARRFAVASLAWHGFVRRY
jgi:NADH dehydrogenase [ubiquinone] 1 alpha subcomplex assembly factor 6